MKLPALCLLFTLAMLCGAAVQAAVPALGWIQQIGSSRSDYIVSVAVDSAGNAYVTGYTDGSLGDANAGNYDVFLAKFDSNGSQLWTAQLGTNSNEKSRSVAVDAVGNVYIAGDTIDYLGAAHTRELGAFLMKFDSSGNELWTEQIGNSSLDYSGSVTVDDAGNAYITGSTYIDLEGPNAGNGDAFLIKFDASGSRIWTAQFGSSSHDNGSGVAVDAAGNIYVSGSTYGSFGAANEGLADAFWAKFDSSGNELWIKQAGSSDYDHSRSIAVDAVGNAYASWSTYRRSGDANGDYGDAFVIKIDSNGNELWTAEIGDSSRDEVMSVVVNDVGSAYVSGFTAGSLGDVSAGGIDAFLARLDDSGNVLWAEQIGTSTLDASTSVAIDAAGGAYITGYTFGSLGGASVGGADAFLAKYRVVPEPGAAVLAALGGVLLLRHEQRRGY